MRGHEVGEGRADGAGADGVFAGEDGDGAAFQVRGAEVFPAATAGRRPPLRPLAWAARNPS
ncbi:hypothetical protein [Nonomuraea sp. NPDC003709]|uniref:hypothetical protein n=1 Tax=Nonomuraea sp. NPDC003709 TaxID=3154450 RepID=UPI0033ACB1E7